MEQTQQMDARQFDFEEMEESELRQLITAATEILERRITRRAKDTLKEARRLAAEVGFEVTFAKTAPAESKGRGRGRGTRGPAVQKYQNPENAAETWSGRGRPPRWVQSALAGGRTMADLQIEAA